jgi:hypothetical protein
LAKPLFSHPLLARKIEPKELRSLNAFVPMKNRLAKAQARRFDALFVHYGLDESKPDAWQNLAWELAATFVPGFQPAKKKGAHSKDRSFHGDLWRAVLDMSSRKNLSIAAVCENLSKTAKFKSKTGLELRREFYRERKTRGETLGVRVNALMHLSDPHSANSRSAQNRAKKPT